MKIGMQAQGLPNTLTGKAKAKQPTKSMLAPQSSTTMRSTKVLSFFSYNTRNYCYWLG